MVISCPEKPVSSSLISSAFFFLFLDSGIQTFVTLLTKYNIRNNSTQTSVFTDKEPPVMKYDGEAPRNSGDRGSILNIRRGIDYTCVGSPRN